MKTIKGDLIKLAIDGQFDVIVHGCNCFHTMGAGIALQIQRKFPKAFKADKETEYGDSKKLGTFSYAEIKIKDRTLYVVNAYTQYSYKGKRNADYKAIQSAFKEIKKQFIGQRIGYPMIGAGLAGGDWNRISKIIDKELEGEDHTLVEYNGNG